MMRTRLVVAIGWVLLIQLACSDDDVNIKSLNDDSEITSLNGTWKVISFEDYANNSVKYKTDKNSAGYEIIMTFNDTKHPHELFGKNTTNTVFGEFEYSGIRKIKINNYSTTQVAEPSWATNFNKALHGELTYEINSSKLRFYYENNSRSVTLIKQ